MLSIEGLKVEFGVKPLFQDVSFVVNDRDRIALVGKNGAGKSTMLKILCGQQKPTGGVVAIPNENYHWLFATGDEAIGRYYGEGRNPKSICRCHKNERKVGANATRNG